MRVTPVAYTLIDWTNLLPLIDGTAFADAHTETYVTDADHLGEFAGRACYKAFNRANPDTASTRGYLDNILEQGHYSVLEHASVSFYVQGVSRSLLLELERHRFLSFSVESQRYVNQAKSHPDPVIPPAFRGTDEEARLINRYARAMRTYERACAHLMSRGFGLKQAREAARAFLPNATPVDFLVTGNLRCWRDVLSKRYSLHADREIMEFAGEILRHLRELAPLSVQDFGAEVTS